MRVIVTGSRSWDRKDVVWAALDILATEAAKVGDDVLVVAHGACSGTTGMVALRHGRRFVGIDLSAKYLDLALSTRLGQSALLDDIPAVEEVSP